MYSRIILMGRITGDLELKRTPNRSEVLSFGLAVQRPYTTKNGERVTDFFNIVAWQAQAEFIAKYFKKGSLILIEGRPETREYIDKKGTTQRIVEIVVEKASFTGEKASQDVFKYKDIDNEDLPF